MSNQKERLKPGQAYKQQADSRRAAYDDLVLDIELCQDFVGSFARESASATGDATGDVRDRYDTIVVELRAAQNVDLRSALAEEYARDRRGLMRFLSAVFERWQRIDHPNSPFPLQVIAQQHLGKPKIVAEYAQNAGAVSKCTTAAQIESLRARIKQYHSRDRRQALESAKRRGDRNTLILA